MRSTKQKCLLPLEKMTKGGQIKRNQTKDKLRGIKQYYFVIHINISWSLRVRFLPNAYTFVFFRNWKIKNNRSPDQLSLHVFNKKEWLLINEKSKKNNISCHDKQGRKYSYINVNGLCKCTRFLNNKNSL